MEYKNVAVNAIILLRGRKYVKMGDSHAVDCGRFGKDHIIDLGTSVQVVRHANVCDI